MKIIKYLSLILLILAIAAFVAIKYFSEEKPIGVSGSEADELADNMLQQLNIAAYDTISYINFEFFGGGHKYFWDKKNNMVIIRWDDNKVVLNTKSQESRSYVSGNEVLGDDNQKLKDKAWSYWCNDSFWLVAPYKVYDAGTERKIVDVEEGAHGLMIEYLSGGVTPGDSYLWILDENYMPTGFKMWTQILPVKGLYTNWDEWNDYNGAKLCITHKLAGKKVSMENVKVGSSYLEFGYDSDPFKI